MVVVVVTVCVVGVVVTVSVVVTVGVVVILHVAITIRGPVTRSGRVAAARVRCGPVGERRGVVAGGVDRRPGRGGAQLARPR